MCKVYRKVGQGLLAGTPPPPPVGWSHGRGFLAARAALLLNSPLNYSPELSGVCTGTLP